MPHVVGVAFKPVTKIYYFDPAGFEDLRTDDFVVVETSRGRTIGQVVFVSREVPASELTGPLKPVVRRATAWDMVQADQMAHKEPGTLTHCSERAKALNLPIKIVKAEWSFDGSSLVVYFSAEQRVDFRNLVHDLSQSLKARVEMRQVGVRDEAKFLGGYGRCGRELCCSTWLREFTPVSIKMAKQQDLPLDASEVSGLCARLLCCLSYENDFYSEARQKMPRINAILMTPHGPGKVKQVHVLANMLTVQVEGPGETRLMVDVPVPESTAEEPAGPPPAEGRQVERETDLAEEIEEGPVNSEEPSASVAAPGGSQARPSTSAGRRSRGRRGRR